LSPRITLRLWVLECFKSRLQQHEYVPRSRLALVTTDSCIYVAKYRPTLDRNTASSNAVRLDTISKCTMTDHFKKLQYTFHATYLCDKPLRRRMKRLYFSLKYSTS
jgi:hypothetical protein